MLQVDFSTANIYQYDVKVTPAVPVRVQHELIVHLLAHPGDVFNGMRPAYDGRATLYTKRQLKGPFPVVVETTLPGEDRAFKLALQEAAVVNFESLKQFLKGAKVDNPQQCIQTIDIIMRTTPSLR